MGAPSFPQLHRGKGGKAGTSASKVSRTAGAR
jgi:hypothetical protein